MVIVLDGKYIMEFYKIINQKDKKSKCFFSVLIILLISAFFLLLYRQNHVQNTAEDSSVIVYLVRHGQTEANVEGVLVGGDSDSMLTDEGRLGAEALGYMLSDVSFSCAYSSELGRAISTREIILSENKYVDDCCKTEELPGLNDISWGDVEGLSIEDASQLIPDLSEDTVFGTISDRDFVSPIHAESKYDFYHRFQDAMTQIVTNKENQNRNVLVVTHSAMTFWLMEVFDDKTLSSVDNASVTIIKYTDGEWELISFNQIP